MKIKRILLFMSVTILGISGCAKESPVSNTESEFSTTSETMKSDLFETEDVQTDIYSDSQSELETVMETEQYYSFNTIELLDRDNKFLLETDYELVVIDTDGSIIENPETDLNSQYLAVNDGTVYNLLGNDVTDTFVTDYEHQEVLSVCRLKDYDVVWIKERKETPQESLIILRALDEKGEEIYSIDTKSEYFDDEEDAINSFKYCEQIRSDSISGTVCTLYETLAGTTPFMRVNLSNKKILPASFGTTQEIIDDYFIYDSQVYNIDGEIVDINEENSDVLSGSGPFSNGLIFNREKQAFYDKNLNMAIDLSDYNVINDDAHFQDGVCILEMNSPSGTIFYGVIDTSGNWVIDPVECIEMDIKRINEDLYYLLVAEGSSVSERYNYVYNDKTNNLMLPDDYEISYFDNTVDGKQYKINDYGEVSCYDFVNNSYEVLEIK